IQPPVLADRGLEGAIRALALDLAVPVTVSGAIPGRAPVPVESAAYFAVCECLANVVKHSGALHATVDLGYGGGVLSVVVRDDGAGGASLTAGSGLRGVARRLEVFDGTITLTSPVGGPTVVRMEVPCELTSTWRPRSAIRWRSPRRSRSSSRTSPSWMSGCRPRSPTRAWWRPSRRGPGGPACPSWCSASMSSSCTPAS